MSPVCTDELLDIVNRSESVLSKSLALLIFPVPLPTVFTSVSVLLPCESVALPLDSSSFQ
jgi:hypothetical protein